MAYMCFMFSVTMPIGIILGMIAFSMTGYDNSSPHDLMMESLLGSLSFGIYMGLVDIFALYFFHNKLMASDAWLKKASSEGTWHFAILSSSYFTCAITILSFCSTDSSSDVSSTWHLASSALTKITMISSK